MSNNMLLELTDQERDEYSRILVTQRLKTREDLKFWLLYFLDVDLADCAASRYATSTPLDMVFDIYQFCAKNEIDGEPLSTFYIAGRGSQKTLSSAVLAILLPLHFKRGIVHLGGTEDQANRAYAYFKKFASRPYIKDYLKDAPKISKSAFMVNGEEVEVEILPITESSVQGPHQPVVSIDELASLAPNKLAAYPSIAGIPVYTQDGKPWIKFGISSRKGRYTIIETEYEERHKTGAVFKFWTVLENTKRCPDEISGIDPLEMYVNIFENKALLAYEYEQLDDLQKGKFEKVQARKGCYTCPLKAVCSGDLKKQTSECRSLKPVRATIQDFKLSPFEWFISQRMSLQPSAEDLVYPKFKRSEFEKTPKEIYQILTGKDPGVELTENDLIREMERIGVKRYAGIDHGYTHPFSIVICYEDSLGNIYIMKVHEESGLEPGDVVEVVSKLKAKYHFNIVYPDTAAPAINKMIKKVVNVSDDFKKDVEAGIQLIRYKMVPSVGPTKLYGLKGNCDPLVNNLEKYHFAYDTSGKLTDKPVKEFDDSHDALSYVAQNRWNAVKNIVNPTMTAQESEVDKNKREKDDIYKNKVQKQYENWMQKEIGTAVQESGGTNGMSKSKSGTHFWDID
jgi:hypothetical protein